MSNKLAKSEEMSVADVLRKELRNIQNIVPSNVSGERLARIAFNTIRLNPKLQSCSANSLVNAIMGASKLGLEVDPLLGQAYLVPYKEECRLIIGYRGLITLARRSGAVQAVYAHAVFEGDSFEYSLGLSPDCIHRRGAESDDAKLTHVYAVIKFKDGSDPHLEVMDRNEVDRIRQRVKASTGPWTTDFAEMAKKTVLRRALKYCPLVPELPDEIVDEYGEVKTKVTQLDELTEQMRGAN